LTLLFIPRHLLICIHINIRYKKYLEFVTVSGWKVNMSIQFDQGDRSKKGRADKCAQNAVQQILRHLSPLTLYLYVENYPKAKLLNPMLLRRQKLEFRARKTE
jgi:hypothetical protein